MKKNILLFLAIFAVAGLYLVRDKNCHNIQKPVRVVQTMYGDFEVTDPAVGELLDSPVMQRIKKIQQYGILHYVKKGAVDFTRYEHCVGVWALLKKFGASREEQIAGLLHDASHTVFSHVADFLYKHQEKEKSYQDLIHDKFLKKYDVHNILRKHGVNFEDICNENHCTRLEQKYPDLCADRIEYSLRGSIKEGIITQDDVNEIVADLGFEDGKWYFKNPTVARKFLTAQMHLVLHVWGGPYSFVTATWAAHTLRRALEIGLITEDDIHFSTDDVVWDKLTKSKDSVIQEAIELMRKSETLYTSVGYEQKDMSIPVKFRGIDPWIKQENGAFERLSKVDPSYLHEFESVKKQVSRGYHIQFAQLIKEREDLRKVMVS